MEIALYLKTDESTDILFEEIWSIPLIRRVWLSWRNQGFTKPIFIVPKTSANKIRQELNDPFWKTFSPTVLEYRDRSELDKLLQEYSKHELLNAVRIFNKRKGSIEYRIHNRDSLKTAEKALAEDIRLGAPTWVAREINKRISLVLSYYFAKLNISPNAISIVGFFMAFVASILASRGTETAILFAGLLLQLNSIIDGSDGEVARLTFRQSKIGARLDVAIDFISILIFTIGISVGLYATNPALIISGTTIIIGALFLLLIVGLICRKSPARQLIAADEDDILNRVVPNRFTFSLKKSTYLLFFILSRRDAYIFTIFILGFFSSTAIYYFLIFLFVNTLAVTYVSIRKVERLNLPIPIHSGNC